MCVSMFVRNCRGIVNHCGGLGCIICFAVNMAVLILRTVSFVGEWIFFDGGVGDITSLLVVLLLAPMRFTSPIV